MDYIIKWSPEAIEDLESIADYIARDSEFYARSVVSKLLAVSREIPGHPLLGRMVPELSKEEIRERFVYSYRLVYIIQNSSIIIVAIIHAKNTPLKRKHVSQFSYKIHPGHYA